MREHKFRAWCKKDKLMYWDIQNGITFDDGSRYTFDQFLNPSSDDYHEWVIEEYTGLPDKNGVEIYESDKITNGDKNIKYVVEWIDCGFRARQIGNKSSIGLEYWKDSIEVIGNIHQEVKI